MKTFHPLAQRESCFSWFFWGALLAVLAIAGGCWQEIRYDPNQPDPDAVASQTSTEAANTTEPSTANPAEELFGAASEPIPLAEQEGNAAEERSSTEELSADAGMQSDTSASENLDGSLDDNVAPLAANESPTNDSPTPTEDLATSTDSAGAEVPETETDGVDVLQPSRTALATWRMCSRWSYAAALRAKHVDERAVNAVLEQAKYAAELLSIELPPLPEGGEDSSTTIINYLVETGRNQIADQLAAGYSPQYAAIAELAVKTHVLLLVYTPKSRHLDPIVAAIRQAAEDSGLPTDLWAELVQELEDRDSFEQVKQTVLRLHEDVSAYLAATTDEGPDRN